MHKKLKFILPLLAVFMILGALPCSATHIAVIVDKGNTAGELSSAELVKILQTNQKTWQTGKKVILIVPASDEAESALQRLLKLSASDLHNFIAAHRDSILRAESDSALLKMVEKTPGAIGLIDVYAITSTVNVLKIDGKLPLEQGYLLH